MSNYWMSIYDGPQDTTGGGDTGAKVSYSAIDNTIVAASLQAGGTAGSGLSVRKYKTDGTLLWQRFVIATTAGGVAVASDGSIYLGFFYLYSGYNRSCIVKITSAGEFVWQKTINLGEYASQVREIAIDGNDNPILAGYYYNATISRNVGYVCKFDSVGNITWFREASISTGDTLLFGMAVDVQNNIVACGRSYNTTTNSAFVFKLDTNGNLLWKKAYGAATASVPTPIATDSAGNVVVAGLTNAVSSDYEVYIRKFDSNGNHVKSKVFRNALVGTDSPNCLAFDSQDNLFLGGYVFASSTAQNGFLMKISSDLESIITQKAIKDISSSNVNSVNSFKILQTSDIVVGVQVKDTVSANSVVAKLPASLNIANGIYGRISYTDNSLTMESLSLTEESSGATVQSLTKSFLARPDAPAVLVFNKV